MQLFVSLEEHIFLFSYTPRTKNNVLKRSGTNQHVGVRVLSTQKKTAPDEKVGHEAAFLLPDPRLDRLATDHGSQPQTLADQCAFTVRA